MIKTTAVACLVALAGLSSQAFAYDKGDFVVRAGAVLVDPQGDGALNGALDVDDNTQLGINMTYMFTDNIGLGVLGATPFEHDITLNGAKIGSTKHLPPTITAQYHFDTGSAFKPYVGVGLNYTVFFEEESTLGDLELDDSVGVAFEAGVDYWVNDKWGVNFSIWKADIDSDAKLDGADLDTVEIDPLVYLLAASYKF